VRDDREEYYKLYKILIMGKIVDNEQFLL
jgi:hypothetical protein